MARDIEFRCPECDDPIAVSARSAGRSVRCPNRDCRETVEVPFESDVDAASVPRQAGVWIVGGSVAVGTLMILTTILVTGKAKAPAPASNLEVAAAAPAPTLPPVVPASL